MSLNYFYVLPSVNVDQKIESLRVFTYLFTNWYVGQMVLSLIHTGYQYNVLIMFKMAKNESLY